MVARTNDVMWFILVDWLIAFISRVQKNFTAGLPGLPSNADAECNTAGDEKGMMPDFC
jgi:hypothetical protein